MRYFLAVLASLLLVNKVSADGANFDANLSECAKEAGVKIEDLQAGFKNNDPKVECVAACALKKTGMMVDGKLDKDAIISTLESSKDDIPDYDKVKEHTLHCCDEVASGGDLPECQLAAKFIHCLFSKSN